MPPFPLWNGHLTRDTWQAYKAALQLDPNDDEAEQRIRMALEMRTTDDLEQSLRLWLRDVIPSASSVELNEIERRLESGKWRIRDVLRRALQDSADLGVSVAVDQFENIGFGFDWTLANQAAAEWVEQYTFELVNGITDTTRSRLRTAVPEWVNNGDPLQSLIDDLAPTFVRRRAELIASTEVTRAYAEGNRQAYRASGVVDMVEWRTSEDERVCPICGPLAGKEAPLGGTFDGGLFPPAHPRCRCWVVPVIEDAPQRQEAQNVLTESAQPQETVLAVDDYAAGRAWNEQNDPLDKAEKKAVKAYTKDDYRTINSFLYDDRLGYELLQPKYQKTVDDLDSALEKMARYDGKVYRGMRFTEREDRDAFLSQLTDARTPVRMPAFTSTTPSQNVVKRKFAGGQNSVVMEIKSNNGRVVGHYSHYKRESEVLFRRESMFKVVDTYEKDNVMHVVMEEYDGG
jgi:SPP1 gp7 family putative phage head morphogenesis protein